MSSIAKYVLVLLSVLAVSCGPSEEIITPPPSDLIEKEVFAQIIADMTLIEAIKNLSVSDELKDGDSFAAYYDGVWSEHQVSEERFIASFDYYEQLPLEMATIYRKAADQLKAQEKEVEKKKKENKETRDEESKVTTDPDRTVTPNPMNPIPKRNRVQDAK